MLKLVAVLSPKRNGADEQPHATRQPRQEVRMDEEEEYRPRDPARPQPELRFSLGAKARLRSPGV